MLYERLVSADFANKVKAICKDLGINPDWLMAAMYFETARTFSPSIRNGKAVGLIQFTPIAASSLNTTVDYLATLNAVSQLDYVKRYLWPYRSRIKSVYDLYLSIFNPAHLGKPDNYILYRNGQDGYTSNKGLDFNKDGFITIADLKGKIDKFYKGSDSTINSTPMVELILGTAAVFFGVKYLKSINS